MIDFGSSRANSIAQKFDYLLNGLHHSTPEESKNELTGLVGFVSYKWTVQITAQALCVLHVQASDVKCRSIHCTLDRYSIDTSVNSPLIFVWYKSDGHLTDCWAIKCRPISDQDVDQDVDRGIDRHFTIDAFSTWCILATVYPCMLRVQKRVCLARSKLFIAPFNNIQTPKFKAELTNAFSLLSIKCSAVPSSYCWARGNQIKLSSTVQT